MVELVVGRRVDGNGTNRGMSNQFQDLRLDCCEKQKKKKKHKKFEYSVVLDHKYEL